MARSSSRMSASSAPIISRSPNTDSLFDRFRQAAEECRRCIEAKLPLPAYDQAIKASHIFNTAPGPRRDLGRRAPGLYRPGPRPGEGRLPGLDGEERVGGVRLGSRKGAKARRVAEPARRGSAHPICPSRIVTAAALAGPLCAFAPSREPIAGSRFAQERAVDGDFLLELLSEEIPARMQDKARADLARLFAEQLGEAGLTAGAVETYATPRRLVLIARGLPAQTEAVSRGDEGPAHRRAAAGARGLPAQDRPHPGPARRARRRLVRDRRQARPPDRRTSSPRRSPPSSAPFPGPSRCAGARPPPRPRARAGCARCRTSSPCSASEVVDFEIAGIQSGAATVGHRFHHPGAITIGGAHDYVEKLRACHVIVDPGGAQGDHPQGVRQAPAQDQDRSRTKGWSPRMPASPNGRCR